MFNSKLKNQLILLYSLFLLLFIVLTVLFSTIHETTVLFQLTFTFIYNYLKKKISVLVKYRNPK